MSTSLMGEVGAATRRTAARATGSTALLFSLSFIAGMVDVTSFVLLHGVFTAHITGNLVVLAADVAAHRSIELTSVLAVLVFVAVTAVLTAVVDTAARPAYRWAQPFLGLQFALLAVVAVTSVALDAGGHHGPTARLAIVVLAVGAMAAQNALLHLTFETAPSTAVMTGNTVTSVVALTGMALGRWRRGANGVTDRTGDRITWQRSWPTLAGFLAGCLLGAASCEVMHWWAWVIPAAVGGLLAAAVASTGLPSALRRD